MPNHTQNRLIFTGKDEDIQDLLNFIQSEKLDDDGSRVGTAFIDFEKIIPMPDNIQRGSISIDEMTKNPNNWYDWSIANWGTKWNAYSTFMENNHTLRFETAWSPPMPVITKLSILFPNVSIKHEYIDEGWSFFGESYYDNGDVQDFCYKNIETHKAIFMHLASSLQNYEFDGNGDPIYEN